MHSPHICVLDEGGVIVSVNRAWRNFEQANRIPGPGEEAGQDRCCVGANYLEICDRIVGPEASVAAEVAGAIKAILNGEREQFATEYACHSPNERRWFLCSISQFSQRKLRRIVIEHINVTERKVAEETLRQTQENFQALLEGASDCTYRYNLQSQRYEHITATVKTLFGLSVDDFLAGTFDTALALIHPDDRPEVLAKLARLEKTGTAELEYRHRVQNGEYRWVSNRVSLVMNPADNPCIDMAQLTTSRIASKLRMP